MYELSEADAREQVEFLRTLGIDPWTRKRRSVYLHLLPSLPVVEESAKVRNVTRSSIFVYLKRRPFPVTLLIPAEVRKTVREAASRGKTGAFGIEDLAAECDSS